MYLFCTSTLLTLQTLQSLQLGQRCRKAIAEIPYFFARRSKPANPFVRDHGARTRRSRG